MNDSLQSKNRYPFLLALILLSGVILLSLNAIFNNKYTAHTIQGAGGVLDLTNTDTDFVYLISGWEFYQYQLLTPTDFQTASPVCDNYVSIGQHAGFELGDKSKNPHGSATYRLTILTNDTAPSMMEIPEIYSSCRIWINGSLAISMGEVNPATFRRGMANTLITMPPSSKIEIILQATDQSSLYSGLTYPPAFGSPLAVTRLFTLRLVFYTVMFTITLLIGISYLVSQWKRSEKGSTILFTLLCIFYAGYISYPMIHSLGLTGYFWYAIESFSLYALLVILILLQGHIFGIPAKYKYSIAAIGFSICIMVIVLPSLWGDKVSIMLIYSNTLMLYKWMTAGYLILSTMIAVLDDFPYSRRLLAGFGVMGIALAIDRIFPLYEPIIAGWPLEIAGFILIILLFSILLSDTITVYRNLVILKERDKIAACQLEAQQTQYHRLITSIEETARSRHDMRHHILAIRSLAEHQDTHALINYINQFDQHLESTCAPILCHNHMINSILIHYLTLANDSHIPMETAIDLPDDLGDISHMTLCVILGNSLENALEASMRMVNGPSGIIIRIQPVGSMLTITIDNKCETSALMDTKNGFLSDKRKRKEHGFGILNIRSAVEQCNGIVKFEPFQNEFHTSILLPLNVTEKK